MGFLDKAKKLAEQAQTKLDEVQGQFNQQPGAAPAGPVTEYDKHGRPVASEPAPAPTPGVPETGSPAAAPVEAPPAAPPAPPTPASEAVMSAQREAGPPVEEDRNHPSYAPPTLTSGDPLAG